MPANEYKPSMPAARVARLRQWHEEVSAELHHVGAHDVDYLGLDLHVPEHVFGPTPTSDLLGRQVLARVRDGHRVLDMGCGTGANAILAARTSSDVTGVDVNPHAVAAATANARRNGVAHRTRFVESDLFAALDGNFDVIVFDPPFRWFRPLDILERAFADENYRSLNQFMREAPSRLRPGGEVLLFFGTSGDAEYLDTLVSESGLSSDTIAERSLEVRGESTNYFVLSLRRP
jgi:release factor glutamine methyltransferase